METTIETIEEALKDCNYNYDGYTVHVENHRILTVATSCDLTVSKWLKEVQKTTNDAKRSNTLIIAVTVDCQSPEFNAKNPNISSPYHLLQLCIGSHCLLYHLPDPKIYFTPRHLRNFFTDPKIMAVGMNIKTVAKNLERHHEMKFGTVVDLNELAVKEMRREDLDLERYDLDQLAKAVLGNHVYVVRPVNNKVEWFNRTKSWCLCCCDEQLTHEKVKYATLDSYLCFTIAWQLFHMIDKSPPVSASTKDKKWKRKNKKKSKN